MVTLELPYPPSTNRIWRRGKSRSGKGVTYLNPTYAAWRKEADAMFVMQERAGTVGTSITGPFEVHLTFPRSKRRSTADLDNRIKPCLDAMQRFGVIENDSLAEKVTASWGPVEKVFIRAFRWSDTSSTTK
jgi:crossover junction endodeoxyribonuclease RusA